MDRPSYRRTCTIVTANWEREVRHGIDRDRVLIVAPLSSAVGQQLETSGLPVVGDLASVAVDDDWTVVDAIGWASADRCASWDGVLARALARRRLLRRLCARGRPVRVVTMTAENCPEGGLVSGMARSLSAETDKVGHTWAEVSLDLSAADNLEAALAARAARVRLDPRGSFRQSFSPATIEGRVSEHPAAGEGAILVTGGAGGLSLHLLADLVSRGHRNVYVLGRSEPDAGRRATLRGIGCRGYFTGDVADHSALEGALDHLRERHGHVLAVYHLAAHLKDGLLRGQDDADFEAVLTPKVAGAINLERAARTAPLGHVVHFSSLSGTLGLAGQTAYGAANAFLDAQAQRLSGRNPDTRWTSLGFGAWDADGMRMGGDAGAMEPMAPAVALDAAARVLAAPNLSHALCFAGAVDFSPLLKASRSAPARGAAEDGRAVAGSVPDGVRTMLESHVRDVVVRFTGIEDLDPEEDVLRQGADSVAAISIAAELERRLRQANPAVRIGRTLLFDHPSVRALTDHLLGAHPDAVRGLAGGEGGTGPGDRAGKTERGTGEADRGDEAASEAGSASAIPGATFLGEGGAPDPQPSGTHYRDDLDIAIVGVAGAAAGAGDLDALWRTLSAGELAVAPIRPSVGTGGSTTIRGRRRRAGATPARRLPRSARRLRRALLQRRPRGCRADGSRGKAPAPGRVSRPGGCRVFRPARRRGRRVHGRHVRSLPGPGYRPGARRLLRGAGQPALARARPHRTVAHLDSMCSGSLSALHLAIASLRRGECRQAVVGAANIMSHSGKYRMLSRGGFLSPTGRCHSFGAEADGYVPGEGVFAVVLKPLGAARRDGDRIAAVIHGSAINTAGRRGGFTVPSPESQAAVIRRALGDAGLGADAVSYVEAHGTGTRLGDPIEIEGLRRSYGAGGVAACAVGTIKSNLGHLEPAAGLAGLIKIVLQLRHGMLAPTIGCEIANPLLGLEEGPFRLQTELEAWDRPGGRPRIAGLSSFGAGGSNAHLIVGEPPVPGRPGADRPAPSGPLPVPVSAKSREALAARCEALARALASRPQTRLDDVVATLGSREHHRHRICLSASDTSELVERLRALPSGGRPEGARDRPEARYEAGETIDWASVVPHGRSIDLPLYPFEERRYWSKHVDRRHVPAVAPTPGRGDDPGERPVANPLRASGLLAATRAHREILVLTQQRVAGPGAPPAAATRSIVARPRPVLIVGAGDAASVGRRAAADGFAAVFAETGPGGGDPPAVRRIEAGDEEGWAALLESVPDDEGRVLVLDLRDLSGAAQAPAADAREAASLSFALARAIARTTRSVDIVIPLRHGGRGDATGFVGLLRSLHREMPTLRAIALEMTEDAGALEATARLGDAIACLEPGLASFSLHRGRLDRRGLADAPWDGLAQPVWRDEGVYLLAGGAGGVGLAVAERLLSQVSARLVLVGRSPCDEALERKLAALHAKGGAVEYRSVDGSDAAAVKALVDDVVARWNRIDGVIHSAGVLADRLIRDKTKSEFDRVVRSKVETAEILDEATRHLPIDLFLMFSSVTASFGNAGQTDYAYANAWLSAFARRRAEATAAGRRSGRTLCIEWPLWRDLGMGIDAESVRFLEERHGLVPMPGTVGADLAIVLPEALARGTTTVSILHGDPDRIRASLLGAVVPGGEPAAAAAEPAGTPGTTGLAARLAALVATITGLEPDEIEADAHWGHLGLNSIAMQRLTAAIEAELGARIPASALFTYGSIAALAEYLRDRIPPTAPAMRAEDRREEEASPASDCASGSHPGAASGSGASKGSRAIASEDEYAIVGMAARLPGAADADAFWDMLEAGRSGVSPGVRRDGHARGGAFIDGIDRFDARFFGLSGREAMLMDPQHRSFLQTAYEAVLDAGYSPSQLKHTGIFAGVQFNDYQVLLQQWGRSRHPFAATGNAHAMLANRVSYLFDWDGPSETLDTACSSALVAVHRAIRSLKDRECDQVLCGAVSLMIDPVVTEAARSMASSPTRIAARPSTRRRTDMCAAKASAAS